MGWANGRRRVVTDFGPDPANRPISALIGNVWARVNGRYSDAVLGSSFDPSRKLTGYADNPQSYVGVASRGHTTNVYRDGGHATIASGIVSGPMGDPARRIFAARLRRETTV